MYLSPSVPELIAEHIEAFVEGLVAGAGYRLDEIKRDLIFAVHPGGPKILEYIQERFAITRAQLHYSWEILLREGQYVVRVGTLHLACNHQG